MAKLHPNQRRAKHSITRQDPSRFYDEEDEDPRHLAQSDVSSDGKILLFYPIEQGCSYV